jgi:hypothetical protein
MRPDAELEVQLAVPNPRAFRSNSRDSMERRLERVQDEHR